MWVQIASKGAMEGRTQSGEKKAKEPRINGDQISGAKSLKTHTTLATLTLIVLFF